MDLEQHTITITGVSPYIMHNGRLADEGDCLTVARQEAQQAYKKNPTPTNWQTFVRAMLEGGIYYDASIGVYLPEDSLRAALVKAAVSVKVKGQKTYKSSASTLIFADMGFVIHIDGKALKSLESVLADTRFHFARVVKIGKSRVRSVRPVMPIGWQATIGISFMATQMSLPVLVEIFQIAGMEVGLGDWRPSAPKPGPYGRFLVTAVDGKEVA